MKCAALAAARLRKPRMPHSWTLFVQSSLGLDSRPHGGAMTSSVEYGQTSYIASHASLFADFSDIFFLLHSPCDHGLKIDSHSARAFSMSAGVSLLQSIFITFRLSIGGAYAGFGLTNPLRADIIASLSTMIFWPTSDSMKSTHSFAAAGCGAAARMNIACGSNTTPSFGSRNLS